MASNWLRVPRLGETKSGFTGSGAWLETAPAGRCGLVAQRHFSNRFREHPMGGVRVCRGPQLMLSAPPPKMWLWPPAGPQPTESGSLLVLGNYVLLNLKGILSPAEE